MDIKLFNVSEQFQFDEHQLREIQEYFSYFDINNQDKLLDFTFKTDSYVCTVRHNYRSSKEGYAYLVNSMIEIHSLDFHGFYEDMKRDTLTGEEHWVILDSITCRIHFYIDGRLWHPYWDINKYSLSCCVYSYDEEERSSTTTKGNVYARNETEAKRIVQDMFCFLGPMKFDDNKTMETLLKRVW
jgi:hypothetical protein